MNREFEELKLIARYPKLDRLITKYLSGTEETIFDEEDELVVELYSRSSK